MPMASFSIFLLELVVWDGNLVKSCYTLHTASPGRLTLTKQCLYLLHVSVHMSASPFI